MENENEIVEEVVIVEAETIAATPEVAKTITLPHWVNKKNIVIAVIVIIVLALAYSFKGALVAATVNGQFISRMSVVHELEKTSGRATLDAMINDRLIMLEAAKQNISVSDETVNEEMAKLEKQLLDQGQNLDEVLATQGVNRDDIKKRIILQKELEQMLGDKLNVSDEEVEQYIKDNAITLPKDKEAETKDQIKEGIRANKLNEEAQGFIETLKTNAKINYFVKY